MQNLQDNFETLKRSFISTFSICMTVYLMISNNHAGSINIIMILKSTWINKTFIKKQHEWNNIWPEYFL